jgi:hypothetical protein
MTQPEFFHDPIDGLYLTQNKYIDNAFSNLKDGYTNVIEIGTCYGGFALFLRSVFAGANVHTFDIKDWGNREYVEHRNKLYKEKAINYYNEDCFLHDGRRIKGLLKEKSILLCDGAHKENEFTFFSRFLQSGSIIMAHDYGQSEEYFKKEIEGKYWTSSFEFNGSKFNNWCEDYRLIPYYQDEFERAVWFIRKKI